jgi:hypothetical protein
MVGLVMEGIDSPERDIIGLVFAGEEELLKGGWLFTNDME